ncbi:hypothetical protein FACS189468_4480 [Spirochaetia bacterium]|nr:hypothetical protein FACS189468_4480 [Spirochaetia bacterium]
MSTNWLPGSRVGQLALARQWAAVLADKASDWGIPAAMVSGFIGLITAAEEALAKVQDKSSRTHVDSVVCNMAFKALTEQMKFLKNNYFNCPPRTEEEMAMLGLRKRKQGGTVPAPLNVVGVETRPLANGLLELVLTIIGDLVPDTDASDYGYRVYLGVEDPAAAPGALGRFGHYLSGPPINGRELTYSFFTKRRRDVVQCDEQDRMKKLWICVMLESESGKQGPWGPLFWAPIP